MFPVLMLTAVAPTFSTGLIDLVVTNRTEVKVTVERKVCVELAVRTGDPLGSREKGTLKTLSEPKLVIAHRKEGLLRAGGKVAVPNPNATAGGGVTMEPVGIEVMVTPVIRLDGKIQLDGMIRESEVNPDRGLQTATGFIPGLDERTMRYSAVVNPGQRVKVRVSSRSVTDQTWVEFVANVQELPCVVPASGK